MLLDEIRDELEDAQSGRSNSVWYASLAQDHIRVLLPVVKAALETYFNPADGVQECRICGWIDPKHADDCPLLPFLKGD